MISRLLHRPHDGLPDRPENVYGRNDDGSTGKYGRDPVEGGGILPGTHEYGDLCYKAAEARQPQGAETGDHEYGSNEGHHLEQTAQLLDHPRMRSIIDHPDRTHTRM